MHSDNQTKMKHVIFIIEYIIEKGHQIYSVTNRNLMYVIIILELELMLNSKATQNQQINTHCNSCLGILEINDINSK